MTLPSTNEPEISVEERWALLQRIVDSQLLRRSARLRELLLYIGDQTVRQGRVNLREQDIGEAVFGRPAQYDTSVDNIVRVNATELRKRLDQYFLTEGSGEDLILDLPRGGNYSPTFRHRRERASGSAKAAALIKDATVDRSAVEVNGKVAAFLSDTSPTPVESGESSSTSGTRRALWLGGLPALCIVLAVALGALCWQNARLRSRLQPWRGDPVLSAFWSRFFIDGEETYVVSGDTSLAIEQLVLKREIPLEEYLSNSYKQQPEPPLSSDLREILMQVRGRNNGSFGDFQVARSIFDLEPSATNIRFRSVRDALPDTMRTSNVILVGSRASNPWVDLYNNRLNFRVDFQPTQWNPSSRVVNRAPKPGEQSSYESVFEHGHVGYSVIAFLPNISPERAVLLVAGTDSQATQAAGVFVTSPEGLRKVSTETASGKFPYFEVLLRSTRMAGTTLQTDVVALRTTQR